MTFFIRSPRRLLVHAASAAVPVLVLPVAAFAHVILAPAETRPDTTYRAVLQVPHGCAGAPTTALRVEIPEGVIGVKPMPKPGWTLAVTRGTYAKAYPSHGKTVTEGAREIVWSGGSLPDDNYDEFVFTGVIAGDVHAGDTVYFPTVQRCASGEERWTEIPAAGQSAHDLKSPAPGVRIVADAVRVAQAQDHGGHAGMAGMDKPAAAEAGVKAGDLVVAAPWTRATPGGAKVAGGYLKITNTGKEPDRLTGGSAPFAGRVEVHEMSMEGGVMKMRPVSGGLTVKPGETVELKPGGYHVMFLDLKQPLKEGDTVNATLNFEKAGPVELGFKVNGVGAGAGAPAHQH